MPAFDIVPTDGLMLHFTDPEPDAVNCWLCEDDKDTWFGVTASFCAGLDLKATEVTVGLLISSFIGKIAGDA